MVLSEDQRQEKQKLIAENRQRRHLEFIRTQLRMEEQQHQLSEEDRQLCKIVTVSFSDAVDQAAPVGFSPPVIAEKELLENAVSRLTRFALQIPGFIISAHQVRIFKKKFSMKIYFIFQNSLHELIENCF